MLKSWRWFKKIQQTVNFDKNTRSSAFQTPTHKYLLLFFYTWSSEKKPKERERENIRMLRLCIIQIWDFLLMFPFSLCFSILTWTFHRDLGTYDCIDNDFWEQHPYNVNHILCKSSSRKFINNKIKKFFCVCRTSNVCDFACDYADLK